MGDGADFVVLPAVARAKPAAMLMKIFLQKPSPNSKKAESFSRIHENVMGPQKGSNSHGHLSSIKMDVTEGKRRFKEAITESLSSRSSSPTQRLFDNSLQLC